MADFLQNSSAKAHIARALDRPFNSFPYGGYTFNYLDNANYSWAYSFTPDNNVTIDQLAIYVYSVTSPPTYRLGIQAKHVTEDRPSGTWLTSNTFTPSAGWNKVVVDSYTLLASTKYFFIIQYASSTIGISNYCTINHWGDSSIYDEKLPYSLDSNIMSQTYFTNNSGTNWNIYSAYMGYWAIPNTTYGRPYTNYVQGRVYGARHRGTSFKFSKNFTFNAIQAWIKKGGTPTENMEYEIRDSSDNSVVSSGTFATPDNVITWIVKTTKVLTSQITLNANTEYYLAFKQANSGGDASNYYDVHGPSVGSIDQEINTSSYGGNQYGFVGSDDSGSTWATSYGYDISFNFANLMGNSPKANILLWENWSDTASFEIQTSVVYSHDNSTKANILVTRTNAQSSKANILKTQNNNTSVKNNIITTYYCGHTYDWNIDGKNRGYQQ